jgi:hypothetical protein
VVIVVNHVLLGLAFCCYTPIITFHFFGVCELCFTWSYDDCFEIEVLTLVEIWLSLWWGKGVLGASIVVNFCKFFLARKQAQFCACCFYVSFDFHHFSHFEITICNLSVPWFRVVLGNHDSFMHSTLLGCTLLITKMLLFMNFTVSIFYNSIFPLLLIYGPIFKKPIWMFKFYKFLLLLDKIGKFK